VEVGVLDHHAPQHDGAAREDKCRRLELMLGGAQAKNHLMAGLSGIGANGSGYGGRK